MLTKEIAALEAAKKEHEDDLKTLREEYDRLCDNSMTYSHIGPKITREIEIVEAIARALAALQKVAK